MLRKLELSGFKSIKQATIDLKPINVLIGANGAGKSNLVSFFDMLQHMMRGQLSRYVARQGYARGTLYYGPKTTPHMEVKLDFSLEIQSASVKYHYRFVLTNVSNGALVFGAEDVNSDTAINGQMASFHNKDFDNQQSLLLTAQYEDLVTASIVSFLERSYVYHFNDTSFNSRIRQPAELSFNRYLANNGGNLAPVLYKLKKIKPPYYQRIIKVIQQIAPFFNDFVLEPEEDNSDYITLRWRSRHSDTEFGVHQLSDGTIRAMALITLLLQPEENLPSLIVIDEPELGLHPYALSTIIGLAKAVTDYGSQVILATQSTTLLDHFEPEDIIVVEQDNGESSFKRLNSEELQDWLEDYSLSELWEKNVLGGTPS